MKKILLMLLSIVTFGVTAFAAGGPTVTTYDDFNGEVTLKIDFSPSNTYSSSGASVEEFTVNFKGKDYTFICNQTKWQKNTSNSFLSFEKNVGGDVTFPDFGRKINQIGIYYGNTAKSAFDLSKKNGNDFEKIDAFTFSSSADNKYIDLTKLENVTLSDNDIFKLTCTNTNNRCGIETLYIVFAPENQLPVADVQIENVVCKKDDTPDVTFTKLPEDIGTLTYQSSNPEVAEVVEGTILALQEGEATITVSWEEGVYQAGSTTFTVTVEGAVATPVITPNGGNINVLDEITISSIDDTAVFSYTVTKPGEETGEFVPYTVPFTLTKGEWIVVARSTIGNESKDATATFTVSKLDAEGLKYAEQKYTAYIDEGFTAPRLENPADLPIQYSSDNNDVASVDKDGNVTLVSKGEARITATFAGNETYNASSSYYILTVEPTRPLSVTFDFTTGSAVEGEEGAYGMTVKASNYEQNVKSIDEGPINVSFTGRYRIWSGSNGNHLRIHGINGTPKSAMTISIADDDYMITKIEFDRAAATLEATPGTYTAGNTHAWTPAENVETNEVTITQTGTSGNTEIYKMTVEWALKPVKAPAIKVNGTECDSEAITLDKTEKEAVIDLGTVPEKYTFWYMWTPANSKRLASAAEEGYTEYTAPITVTENGTLTYFAEHKATGTRSEVKTLVISIPTGVAAIEAENGQAEYFDLQGRRVNADELVEGIYIRRANGNTEKVVVK